MSSDQCTYGSDFLKRLWTIGRSAAFKYADLQEIKTLTQAGLSAKLRRDYPRNPELADIVDSNTPNDAAGLFHQRVLEVATANASRSSICHEILWLTSVLILQLVLLQAWVD